MVASVGLSRETGGARGGRLLRRRDANGSLIGTGGGRSPRSVLSSEPPLIRIGGSPLTTRPAPTSPPARRDRAAHPDTRRHRPMAITLSREFGNSTLTFESGKLALQAGGSWGVWDGETP